MVAKVAVRPYHPLGCLLPHPQLLPRLAWLVPILAAAGPSSSAVVASTPPASVAESVSWDDLLALVRNEFVWLMQQQQANPSLSVPLAPPG